MNALKSPIKSRQELTASIRTVGDLLASKSTRSSCQRAIEGARVDDMAARHRREAHDLLLL